jgi:hypothetical protein
MRTKEEIEKEIQEFRGCSKKIDINGDCWYISSQGNLRICPKCKKKREALFEELKLLDEKC